MKDNIEKAKTAMAALGLLLGGDDPDTAIMEMIKNELPGNGKEEVELYDYAVQFSNDDSVEIEDSGIYSHNRDSWWSSEKLLRFHTWLKRGQ